MDLTRPEKARTRGASRGCEPEGECAEPELALTTFGAEYSACVYGLEHTFHYVRTQDC